MKFLLGLFLLLIIVSCAPGQNEKEWKEIMRKREQQAIDKCIKTGGIPFYSSWDGRMIDCKCPPVCK